MSKFNDMKEDSEISNFLMIPYAIGDVAEGVWDILLKTIYREEVVPICDIHPSSANAELYGLPLHDEVNLMALQGRRLGFCAMTNKTALAVELFWDMATASDFWQTSGLKENLRFALIQYGIDEETKAKTPLSIVTFRNMCPARFFRRPVGLRTCQAFDYDLSRPMALVEFCVDKHQPKFSMRPVVLDRITQALNWNELGSDGEFDQLIEFLKKEDL